MSERCGSACPSLSKDLRGLAWAGECGCEVERGGALAINNSAATSSSAWREADAGGAGARGRGSDSLKDRSLRTAQS